MYIYIYNIHIHIHMHKIPSNPIYFIFFFFNSELDQDWTLATAASNLSKGLALLLSYTGNNIAWIQRLVYMVCCLFPWTIDHLCKTFLGNGLNSDMWWSHTGNNGKKFLFSPRIKGLIKVTQLELDSVARSYRWANVYQEIFMDVLLFT